MRGAFNFNPDLSIEPGLMAGLGEARVVAICLHDIYL